MVWNTKKRIVVNNKQFQNKPHNLNTNLPSNTIFAAGSWQAHYGKTLTISTANYGKELIKCTAAAVQFYH